MNKASLKENRLHGNAHYPVSTYHISCPPEEILLDLHWHDEMEWFMVTEGQAVIRVGEEDYMLQAGEAIFINSGELHSGTVAGDRPCSFDAVVFDANLFRTGTADYIHDRYIGQLVQRKYDVNPHITSNTPEGQLLLQQLVSLIETDKRQNPAYELRMKGLLFLMMSGLLQLEGTVERSSRSSANTEQHERLKQVLAYIEEHYKEAIQLKELADLLAMSESYFCRFFKKITTKSPIEYINLHRVRQAALLLKDQDRKVMDVALDVGFNNLSYFNVIFRQHFGCTPSAYRRSRSMTP